MAALTPPLAGSGISLLASETSASTQRRSYHYCRSRRAVVDSDLCVVAGAPKFLEKKGFEAGLASGWRVALGSCLCHDQQNANNKAGHDNAIFTETLERFWFFEVGENEADCE